MMRLGVVLGLVRAASVHAQPAQSTRLDDGLYKQVMQSLPIPTVDVLIFSSDLSRTLLFRRRNNPVKGVYYTIGGRVLKNERLRRGAMRKLHEETALSAVPTELVLGGVVEEIFEDSMFNKSVNSHCINTVYGFVVPSSAMQLQDIVRDSQHADAQWFGVFDPSLHPYVRRKILLLLPKVLERQTRVDNDYWKALDAGAGRKEAGRKEAGRKERRGGKKAGRGGSRSDRAVG